MRRFRYVRDPVCLLACLAYGLNRWVLSPLGNSSFLHGTFNDLLLLPAALPVALWIQRKLGWRSDDRPPTPGEVVGHWLVWSAVCEGLAPLFLDRAVADWWDIAAYAAGGLAAGIWWNRPQRGGTADFDGLAADYDLLEFFLAGQSLQTCRTAFLDRLPPFRHALLVGEGHGRFLEVLRQTHPRGIVTYLDASDGMQTAAVARLRRKGIDLADIHFLRRDLQKEPLPEHAYDLIATHFFLDCFPADMLDDVVARLARAARPGASWLVSDFQAPVRPGLARLRAQVALWLMYRFFRLVTRLPARRLAVPGPVLQKYGFIRRGHVEFNRGLLYAEWWQKAEGGPCSLPVLAPTP